MKIRLGLLGPSDSLEFVQSVISERPEFICTPFECLTLEDLDEKVSPFIEQMDMWLCTGPITYNIVQDWNRIASPIFCIDYNGSSLYKIVLRVLYEQKIEVDEISFDATDFLSWERALQEAGIETKPKYVESEMISLTGLVQYHFDLWKNGQTKAVVTGHPIDHELKMLGVPAYRLLPSSMAVEAVLTNMLRTYEMLHYKSTQTAVQIIEIDTFIGMKKDAFSTDELYRIELKVMENLLTYTNKVHGSIKSSGFGRYVIFTTRGLMQEITGDFSHLPYSDDFDWFNKQAITCGIGIGQTVYAAEINAGNALLHAKECGKGSWMVCFDDKRFTGPLGKQEKITYSYTSKQLESISQQTSLSVMTLNKLKSSLKKLASDELNANELANYMQIPARSARRILTTLEEKGFAEVVAEEKPQTRGRPRKIYKISPF
ncbi:ArsR family transcriptional regulator [Bacillus sp. S/N-304-OC-R1]|uniref:ArsR family transcriptional regulator n=1 Tax=Bacillus sp. S/N-304-OC-R1 TaxID=2758034 RepID=UPI001C8EFC08|nr:ArsR family transcriptional regulator [Bacillus sp. S/N-304-OC-R1]MBY0121732.1 ArsR family transcriptional regulator [Bacillus sp. S/N-304-OC-R1]